MKKALPLLVILFFSATRTHAQINKGAILLGGTIGYVKNTQSGTNPYNTYISKQSYLIIHPSVGVAIKENVIIGIQASYSNAPYNTENPATQLKMHDYGGGLFVRRYIPLLKRFYFFGQAQAAAGFNSGKSIQAQPNANTTIKGWQVQLSVYPGLAYAVTKHFHMEAGLNNLAAIGYKSSKLDTYATNDPGPNTHYTTKSKSFSVTSDLSGTTAFNVGFQFLL